jgi:hypothetical protein
VTKGFLGREVESIIGSAKDSFASLFMQRRGFFRFQEDRISYLKVF